MKIRAYQSIFPSAKNPINSRVQLQTNPFRQIKYDTFELSFKSINLNDKNIKKEILEVSSDIYSEEFISFIYKKLKNYPEDTVQNVLLEIYEQALTEEKHEEIVLDVFSNLSKYKEKQKYNLSLDKAIKNEAGSGTFIDTITKDDLPQYLKDKTPEEKRIIEAEFKKVLSSENITEQEKRILKARYQYTQEENIENTDRKKLPPLWQIGKNENLSYTRVRIGLLRAIGKLRKEQRNISSDFKDFAKQFRNEFYPKFKYEEIEDFLIQNPEIINLEKCKKNIDDACKTFNAPREKYIKCALRQPALFFRNTGALNKNIEDACKIFDISKEEYVKCAIRQPVLFCLSAETLDENINNSSRTFDVPREKFIQCAIRQPSLFYQITETLDKKIEDASKTFDMPREKYINCALRQPALFYLNAETPNKNIEGASQILSKYGIKKEEYLEVAISHPSIFTYDPKNIEGKIKAIEFYVRNMKKNCKDISSKEMGKILIKKDFTLSKDSWYLALLRSKMFKRGKTPEMLKGKGALTEKFTEFLKTNKEYFRIGIYNLEGTEDFIKFVTELSEKSAGKNFFSFNLIEA